MLRTLKDLLDIFSSADGDAPPARDEHTLQLATAVLLVEVMRTDTKADPAEREAVLAALRENFALGEDELARLLELAEITSREAADFHRFTSAINKGFDAAQKLRVIEYMWQVAFADGHLCNHEHHLLRKIADLLYVPHADYVLAKQRAREHMLGRS